MSSIHNSRIDMVPQTQRASTVKLLEYPEPQSQKKQKKRIPKHQMSAWDQLPEEKIKVDHTKIVLEMDEYDQFDYETGKDNFHHNIDQMRKAKVKNIVLL